MAIHSVALELTRDELIARNKATIGRLVEGFALQNLDMIMAEFADDGVYYDVLGQGQHGRISRGKAEIRATFAAQFASAGEHTFIDPTIVADVQTGFASWTLVQGRLGDPGAERFAGIDEFGFNGEGQVIVKKAWLKDIPRLRNTLIFRNPKGWGQQIRYLMAGLRIGAAKAPNV
jgi:hypothetical protein